MAVAEPPSSLAEIELPRRSRSLWRDALGIIARDRVALAGAIILGLIVLIAVTAPLIAPYDPVAQDYNHLLKGPSLSHPFGTDNFGRDILSRIMYGGRISLTMGLFGTLLGVAAGSLIGIIGGFYGGWIDSILMRLLDILLAFPGLLLAIVIIALLGGGDLNVIVAIGIFSIPGFARVLRGSILALKRSDFIMAAQALGARDRRMMLVHLLPNAIQPILVLATLRLGTAILTVASLSFLGLGIQPPSPEWGAMLSDGRSYIQAEPYVALFPGLAILVTVLAVNLLGDGLRDALDPKMRR